jgi:putative two-component system hydrogenase maturation factor HypX/HoxX
MRILLLAHSFNSLTQRLWIELAAAGHELSVEFDINDRVTEEAVGLWRPDLVVAPFLKRRIPETVWRRYRCLVIHPGIRGDRGPSALDWALMSGETEWGVTVLEANGELDAGDVWAEVRFPMREATKSSLYRQEVTEAAVTALARALDRLACGEAPEPLDYGNPGVRGRPHSPMRQLERAIDWRADDTTAILRKIRAADGAPGVLDQLCGLRVYLHGGHREGVLRFSGAAAGDIVAQRDGAILRATCDGAVWITHLKRADGEPRFKLPAVQVLGERLANVPAMPLSPHAAVDGPTWRPICYEERGDVGWLHFPLYNGAMDAAQCERLREAFAYAANRPTRVIVLAGGPDFWSNGIDLNRIEAAAHPAEESLRNIEAIDDLVRDIVAAPRHLTIAAMQGNAGAGGAFLALAADRVFARDGIVLNPHYKSMGNLYGSEYWTYLLPRRVGAQRSCTIMQNRLPLGARDAAAMGLVDACFGVSPAAFMVEVDARARALAADPGFESCLRQKNARRIADEANKPLAAYRDEELRRMRQNFFGFDPSYHVARHHFVAKVPRSRTPLWLARHRSVVARAAVPGRESLFAPSQAGAVAIMER